MSVLLGVNNRSSINLFAWTPSSNLEKSSTIGDRISGRGFQTLNTNVRYAYKRVFAHGWERFCRSEIDLLKSYCQGDRSREALVASMFKDYDICAENAEMRQCIMFNVQASIFFIAVHWNINEAGTMFTYMNKVMEAQFTLMPDYCIVTTSKKSFLNSSTTQSIQYIDRGVTEEDIIQVFNICFTQLNSLSLPQLTNTGGEQNQITN